MKIPLPFKAFRGFFFLSGGNCKTHLPVKTALLRLFASILLSRPAWADLVKWTVVALPPLSNGLKIID
ncbi:MAG: hypothetical protein KGJ02_08270, partial [Verrucomicrobiota bacterium]|nr:hypothetical protein [Verrucomicrobiota bacterium]